MENNEYYENVNLSVVENGYTLNYCKYTVEPKQEYPRSEYKTEVFLEDNVQEALTRMKELHSKKLMKHPDKITEKINNK